MTNLDLNANGDFNLEYKDAVKDPNDPVMKAIETSIPEKYKGKTPEELIDMHVNIEKVLTRQGNELGQLRRIVDTQSDLLTKATSRSQPEPVIQEPLTAENLLNDPTNSVNRVVQPQVQSVNQKVDQLQLQIQEQRFAQSHPTYKQDVMDPGFQSWVLASPIRSKLLGSLNGYNFDAGSELWELWQEHRGAKEAAEAARQARVGAVSVTKTVTGEPVAKPTYSREKLMDLHARAINGDSAAKRKWEDPEFQREYQLAHLENRVK